MQIKILEIMMAESKVRNQYTIQFIEYFIRKKHSESLDETISFQEILNYLKQNKLIIYPEIEQKNSSDEALFTELLTKKIDISVQDKSYIRKKYLWKQIWTLGIYPQLDKTSHSMLGLAATLADTSYIKQLIDDGVDVNLPMNYGMTPLMMAADSDANFSMYNNCIKALLEAGADYDMKNKWGTTALDQAVKNGNEGAVRLLLRYGASVTDKTMAEAEKKLHTKLLPYSAEKNIFNLLTQAKQGIIKSMQPVITEIIEKAVFPKFPKGLGDIVASYDIRSYGLRYFKVSKDNKLEPLISESHSFAEPIAKIFRR